MASSDSTAVRLDAAPSYSVRSTFARQRAAKSDVAPANTSSANARARPSHPDARLAPGAGDPADPADPAPRATSIDGKGTLIDTYA